MAAYMSADKERKKCQCSDDKDMFEETVSQLNTTPGSLFSQLYCINISTGLNRWLSPHGFSFRWRSCAKYHRFLTSASLCLLPYLILHRPTGSHNTLFIFSSKETVILQRRGTHSVGTDCSYDFWPTFIDLSRGLIPLWVASAIPHAFETLNKINPAL